MRLFTAVVLLGIAVVVTVRHVRADPTDIESMLVSYENVQMREQYRFRYETSDGQLREEMGMLINPDTPEQELVLVGKYAFRTKDGKEVMVMYKSDKKGYRAKTMVRDIRNNKAYLSLLGG